MVAVAASKTATVAASDVVALDDIMSAFHLSVLSYNSARRPHLKYQLRIRLPSGKIERIFFKTRQEAESEETAKRVEIENVGKDALNINTRTRLEVIGALEKLKPFDASLTQAVEFFVEHHRSSCTVKEACNLYVQSRKQKSWSARHKRSLNGIISRFTATFGDKVASHLKIEDLEKWFDGLGVGAVSVNSYRRLLHAVFQYAVARGVSKINPLTKLEELQEKAAPVGILTPAQMRKLLVAAKGEPDVLATIAIGGFAGLRPEEIARLKWTAIDVDFDHGHIDCGSEITKTAKHRYVKIEPVLRAWLEPIFRSVIALDDLKTNVQGSNFRRRFDAVRKQAGFSIRGGEGIEWPHDALRHSYASYHLAKFEDAAALALQMGHETTAMIFSNYRARVSEKDADAWWNLLPEEPS
jgi:integrase